MTARGASSHGCPRLAYTLARLIRMLESKELQRSLGKPGPSEVTFDAKTLLIIDEAGMMDTPTLNLILTSIPEGCRLLLSGDDGQLFPIGFGKVFHDLVADGTLVARLTKVLRQDDDSNIPRVASQIREGIPPTLDEWKGQTKGVFLVSFSDREQIQRKLQASDFLLIAARRQTVDSINHTESLSRRTSDTATRRLSPLAMVAVGDPIMMTVNRYKHDLFNGLLGIVTDLSSERVQVNFDGEREPRYLPQDAEGDVELAYGITCHKAQGSSANTAMIIVENTHLVSREWLYTGVTRAKHLVLLVEESAGAIERCVARRTRRTSGLVIARRQA